MSDCAEEHYQAQRRHRRACRDNTTATTATASNTDYPYDWTEDEEAEPASSSYANSSNHGSPQMIHYQSEYPPATAITNTIGTSANAANTSPSSRHSSDLQSATSSAYSYEDEKVMSSLEDRFPFLKEERKRTRKLLTAEQTRVLEAILVKTVYPSTPLREAIARQLGIPPRKVQIWFQNKRQGRRRAPSVESSSGTTLQHRKQRSSEHLKRHHSDLPTPASKFHPRRMTVGEYKSSSSDRPAYRHPPYSAPVQDSYSTMQHKRMHSGSLSSSFAQRSFAMERSPREQLPAIVDYLGAKRAPTMLSQPQHGGMKVATTWHSSSGMRSRPSPLHFENVSARSSSDSLASGSSSSSNSFRGDDWTLRAAALSSSSSKSHFSDHSSGGQDTTLDASLSKHMLSLHQITAAYFASTSNGGEKLQLAPIDGTSRRNESLPSISELILD